jgi:DNA polymerase-3 subunit alpha
MLDIVQLNKTRACSCGFCHLHGHTSYSALDGFGMPSQTVERVKELGFNKTAITDHGNINGFVDFSESAKKAGVKPIFGCEFYLVEDSKARTKEQKGLGVNAQPHITVIARTQKGFSNLIKLIEISYQNYYYKPLIDFVELFQHQEGLTVLSGCVGGWPSRLLTNRGESECKEWLSKFKENIEDFNVEIIPQYDYDVSTFVTDKLIRIGESLNLPFVITADAHFPTKEDWTIQDTMLCINMNIPKGVPKAIELPRYQYYCSDEELFDRGMKLVRNGQALYEENYLLTREKMSEILAQGMENAARIGYLCEAEQPSVNPVVWIGTTKEKTNKEILRDRILLGLAKRYDEGYIEDEDRKNYYNRAMYELDVICDKNFEDYLLIVSDIANEENKSNGFTVCRGSAGGCILLWALYASEIDPIKFDLSFERFYDYTRNDAPDVDIDFTTRNRASAMFALQEKYGEESVAKLLNVIKLKGKSALLDIARIQGLDKKLLTPILQKISSTADNTDEVFEDAEVREILLENPSLSFATRLIGQVRQYGVNAAGVALAGNNLEHCAAIMRRPGTSPTLSVDKKNAPKIGILKLDMLGVQAYDVLHECIKRIGKTPRQFFREHANKFDEEVIKYIHKNKVVGIFQLDGTALDTARKIHSSTFNDIIAVNALCRPGASIFVNRYAQLKNNPAMFEEVKKTWYPKWREITESTFGVLVYQEQVMRVAREMAGMEWVDVHKLRSQISKGVDYGTKIDPDLEKKFLEGMKNSGYAEDWYLELWEKIKLHGKYSFNKSHCVAYALIAYFMLWFKYYYRDIYYSSYLEIETSWVGDNHSADEFLVKRLISEYLEEGGKIQLLSKSKSKATFHFDEESQKIIGGWSNIKGIGYKSSLKLMKSVDPIAEMGDAMKLKLIESIGEKNPQKTVALFPWMKVSSLAEKHAQIKEKYKLADLPIKPDKTEWQEVSICGYVSARKLKQKIGNSKSETVQVIIEDEKGIMEAQVVSKLTELASKFREDVKIGDFVVAMGVVAPEGKKLFIRDYRKISE